MILIVRDLLNFLIGVGFISFSCQTELTVTLEPSDERYGESFGSEFQGGAMVCCSP